MLTVGGLLELESGGGKSRAVGPRQLSVQPDDV